MPQNINFTNVVYMEFKAFLLQDTPSGASVHLFRETLECRQIFPLTCPTYIRGKSSNVNKFLPGFLLSLTFTYLMKSDDVSCLNRAHPKALGGYCRGHTKG